jgi:hypothetical protein
MGSRGHGAFLKNSAGREEYCIAASMPRKLIGINWGQNLINQIRILEII